MKKLNIYVAALSVMFLAATSFAQDTPKGDGPGSRLKALRQQEGGGRPEMAGQMAGAMAQRMPLMMALDTDKDGSISASELENASKALAKLDKDGDGALSAEELRPDFAAMAREGGFPPGQPGAGGPMGKEMMAKMFEQRDADKDGKLSGDEIPERMRENVSRVDENGDGAIDKSEMEKAMAKMGDRAGQMRGGKGDKDGAGVKPKRPPVE